MWNAAKESGKVFGFVLLFFPGISSPSSSSSVADLAIRISLKMGRTDVCVAVAETMSDALSFLVQDHAKNISDDPVRWRIGGGAGDCQPLSNSCEKAATVTVGSGAFNDSFDCGLHFFPAEAFPPNITLRYDSTLLLYNTSEDTVYLREAWSTPKSRRLKIDHFADLKLDGEDLDKLPLSFSFSKRGMDGDLLRVAYAGRHPDFYTRPEAPGELVGYAVDIARMAASALNFTVEFEYQTEGWGILGEDGTWMGVVARLKEGEADLGMMLEPTLERQEVVDFSNRIVTTEVQFFAVKSVSSSSPSLLGGYLAPFSPSTWATAAAALLVLPLALAVTSRGKVGFAQSFGITLSILLQHDQPFDPPSGKLSPRLAHFCAVAFSFLAVVSYSALLTANMVNLPEELEINSLSALADSDVSVHAQKSSSILDRLRNGRGEIREVYEKRVLPHPEDLVLTRQEGVDRIAENPNAVFMTTLTSVSSAPPGLYWLRIPAFVPMSLAFGLQKRSELTEAIDEVIRQAVEGGLIERFKSDHGVGVVREIEGEDAAGSVPPLGYASVALPFLCLAAGAAAAAAANVAERVFTKKKS